ncbi:hypothetical protein COE51_10830 [Bacillus pseudomycoides]|nr:hypothetical protein COE51_10830 [Bacillus pseudomycoides]
MTQLNDNVTEFAVPEWGKPKRRYTGSYGIKETGAYIKYGENEELELETQKLAGKLKQPNYKRELSLNKWKTGATFGHDSLLDWLHQNNEQYVTLKTKDVNEAVWGIIKAQVKLFFTSAGTFKASKEDITEREAISYNLFINERQTMTEISSLLGVSYQTVSGLMKSFFTKVGLILNIGINLKSKLLENFMSAPLLALRRAKERSKAFKKLRRGKMVSYCGINIDRERLEHALYGSSYEWSLQSMKTDNFITIPKNAL